VEGLLLFLAGAALVVGWSFMELKINDGIMSGFARGVDAVDAAVTRTARRVRRRGRDHPGEFAPGERPAPEGRPAPKSRT
jgi:hypothetical protein